MNEVAHKRLINIVNGFEAIRCGAYVTKAYYGRSPIGRGRSFIIEHTEKGLKHALIVEITASFNRSCKLAKCMTRAWNKQ